MKFDCIHSMIDEVNDMVRRTVRETMEVTSADKMGLDRRAGYTLFVNEDFIAVEGDGHMLDYYGGFEYVDKDCVTVMGDYKFYSADDERVRDHIETYFESQGLCESEEAE